MQDNPKLAYDVAEAAKAMGICKTKMYELVKQKGFPVVMVGNKYVIPIKPFVVWLEKQANLN